MNQDSAEARIAKLEKQVAQLEREQDATYGIITALGRMIALMHRHLSRSPDYAALARAYQDQTEGQLLFVALSDHSIDLCNRAMQQLTRLPSGPSGPGRQ